MAPAPTGFLLASMRHTVRFFLPVDCAACGAPLTDDPVPLFCARCWDTIAPTALPRCVRCDRPFASPVALSFSPNHVCQACSERPPSYTKAWTLYPYVSPLQDAICLLKYRGKVSLAAPLAGLMIEALPPQLDVDVIMPVPLHPSRLREREFNQSLLLADRAGRHLDRPLSFTNLNRVAPSPPQTTLSRKHRLRNLRGAFAVREPATIAGKRVLLVDDVFTTGTTVNECAKTLRKAGTGDVFVLTLARTMETGLIPDRVHARPAPEPASLLGG